jgi:colanic acid/amylovoran biosynthesis glycosyltransferase
MKLSMQQREGKREIWYVTMSFPAHSETFACIEIKELQRLRVDVVIRGLGLSDSSAFPMLEEYGLGNCDIISFEAENVLYETWRALKHPKMTWRLIFAVVRGLYRKPLQLFRSLVLVPRSISIFLEISERQPDFVHLFWGHYPCLVAWLIQRYLPTQPWSMSLAAYDLRMDYPLTRTVGNHSRFVRTISKANVPILVGRGISEERIRVIHHGIDLAKFDHSRSTKIPRRIISAGRLIPSKRFDLVIEAVHLLLADFPDTSLVIAGDGPERSKLVSQVTNLGLENCVQFLGTVPQHVLFEELRHSEIFLFLSDEECLPNVVKEAMASGCVSIVSQTLGIETLVINRENGFVVRSLEEAVDCVSKIFRGEYNQTEIIESGRRHVADNFDAKILAGKLLDNWNQ